MDLKGSELGLQPGLDVVIYAFPDGPPTDVIFEACPASAKAPENRIFEEFKNRHPMPGDMIRAVSPCIA